MAVARQFAGDRLRVDGPLLLAVAGNDDYGPLVSHLVNINDDFGIYAPRIQAWLWDGHVHARSDFGLGISAMPACMSRCPSY